MFLTRKGLTTYFAKRISMSEAVLLSCVRIFKLYTREEQNEFLSAKCRYSAKIHFRFCPMLFKKLGVPDSFTGYFCNARYSFETATEIKLALIAGLFLSP